MKTTDQAIEIAARALAYQYTVGWEFGHQTGRGWVKGKGGGVVGDSDREEFRTPQAPKDWVDDNWESFKEEAIALLESLPEPELDPEVEKFLSEAETPQP